MARILVIADEKDIRDVLEQGLRKVGHRVDLAATVRDALAIAGDRRPEIVVLDLALGGGPDHACLALSQADGTRDAELLVLAASTEEIESLVARGVAVSDSVIKPFSVRELIAKTTTLARRGHADSDPARPIEFGALHINRQARRVMVGGEEVDLTTIEFNLLVTLHDRRPRVQARDALLNDVWKIQGAIETRTVDTHVKRLREKLGPAGVYIETVRGEGYRFAATPDRIGG